MAVNLTMLRRFIPAQQLALVRLLATGEEGAFFRQKLAEFDHRIKTMPKTYDQDGKGQDTIAHLHYFHGGSDWYITERDSECEQLQAFGLASLHGGDPELGYVSLPELIAAGAEIDLHFTPAPLRDLYRQPALEAALAVGA